MNKTPVIPPHMASSVICNNDGSTSTPSSFAQMNSAGMVKIIPDANDELADPVVWEMLHSRMVDLPKTGFSTRRIATDTTANGIAVLMVNPTNRPR